MLRCHVVCYHLFLRIGSTKHEPLLCGELGFMRRHDVLLLEWPSPADAVASICPAFGLQAQRVGHVGLGVRLTRIRLRLVQIAGVWHLVVVLLGGGVLLCRDQQQVRQQRSTRPLQLLLLHSMPARRLVNSYSSYYGFACRCGHHHVRSR